MPTEKKAKTFFDIMKLPPIYFAGRNAREPYPFPKRVTMETSSRCNRSCSFCPVSTGRRDFPNELMDWGLFTRIVNELAMHGWEGFFEHYMLNESFLNKRLTKEIAFLREACPKATIYITTNTDLLRALAKKDIGLALDKIQELYDAGLTTLNLNVYDSEKGPQQNQADYDLTVEIFNAVQMELGAEETEHKYTKKPVSKKFIAMTDMRLDEQHNMTFINSLEDRTLEDRKEPAKQIHCSRPQNQLVIDWKGRVILCCAIDPTATEAGYMGDLNVHSIAQIWNAERFFQYRWFTQQKARCLPDCSTCHQRMAYAHVVRKVEAHPDLVDKWREEARQHLVEKGIDLPIP